MSQKTSTEVEKERSKPKLVIRKSFRLLDFHVYDEAPSSSENPDQQEEYESAPKEYTYREYKGNSQQFVIQMFGINEKGETCCIFVNDYTPFFYVEVSDAWEHRHANGLLRELKTKVGKYSQDCILSAELVMYKKLYGFTAGKDQKFVKLTFQNISTMNKVKNFWYENTEGNGRKMIPFLFYNTPLKLYESNIPPLLRYFHIQNISPSGWISIPYKKEFIQEIKTTTCHYEFKCTLKSIIPMNEKETRVPYKICSFDIEASSSHGDFPVPKKTYKRLATNIVDCFLKQSSIQEMDETRAKQLLLKTIYSAFGYSNCDDIDIVYPKVMPSKEKVKQLVSTLISTPIQNVKKIQTEENNSDLLTIDSIFEAIKVYSASATESSNSKGFIGNGNGMGENDGSDDENDEDENDDNHDNDENEGTQYASQIQKYQMLKKKKAPVVDKKSTLPQILISDSYTREEKIIQSNELLTLLFPRLEGDKTTFIGTTFMRYGEPEPYLNHCLVLGSCDPIPGIEVESVDTEKELLIQWKELIQRENPDIIIGYNIFGFDYEFIFRRAEELHCVRDFLELSRKIGDVCANENKSGELSIENTKIQLASGEYDLRYPKINGRLQIDMYAYFRRDFNLSSYKLDDVAGQFISDDVKKIVNISDDPVHGEVTHLYSSNLTGLHIGDYIHIELCGFTTDYYKNGKKFKVVDIIRGHTVTEVVKGKEASVSYNVIVISGIEQIENKSVKWGMAKDDVTPQDIFRLANGSASDRAIVAKYCIQDCNLVHHLMNKIDVITGYVEMSRICSVPISFLVFRGQGIKLTSYVAKKCREKYTLMPDLEKTVDGDGYEGAIVLPPKCSMYMDNPVACVDYSSLYPSSMISQNFSHDSKVWAKEYTLSGKLIRETGEKNKKGEFIYDNLPGYHYIDIEFDTYKYLKNPERPAAKAVKTKVGKMVCRWAQFPDNKKGIMPSILEELLKARSDTRKMAKNEKDPFMQNILDKRQLGYKVTANSLYGQCGAKTSTFYEKDVAASTTATGRMMITYAKRIIEEVYGDRLYDTECHGQVLTKAEYVYGDTDSVFFTFNLVDPVTKENIRGKKALEITIEIAQDAAQLCSQWLKPPMELSYEKTLMPFILLSKKRYVGMLYETDPNKGKLKYMGLSLKRRDSCDYLKDTYGGILNILMKENNIEKSIEFLNQSLENLILGKVSMDKLAITKALRSDYKNPNQIAHKVLADRIGQRDPGNKPKSGDRIKYVHIVNDIPKALQGEKIETPDYIIQNNLKIDYTHYITNQLMKPLTQLFGLALEQIWAFQNKNAAVKTHIKEMAALEKEFPDLEIFMKKREKVCSKKIKALLFDKFLNKIYNEKHGIRQITSFFGKM